MSTKKVSELTKLLIDFISAEEQHTLAELAHKIIEAGASGLNFLVSFIPDASEGQLSAILTSLTKFSGKLSGSTRETILRTSLHLLDSTDEKVIAEAIHLLTLLNYKDAVPLIVPLRKHSSSVVVAASLRFISQFTVTEEAIQFLKEALNSTSTYVQQVAISELDALIPEAEQIDPEYN